MKIHSTHNYVLEKQFEIGKSICNLKKIYLDTNYWIKLREQSKKENPEERIFLDKVKSLVVEKKCILPISEVTFWEILKQDNFNSLKESVNIIDELSGGISLISQRERQKIEFIHFVRSKTGNVTQKLDYLVWTKLSLDIMYDFFITNIPNEVNEMFLDFLMGYTFSDIIRILNDTGNLRPFKFKDDVDALNRSKELYSNENKSFQQLLMSELGGYLEVFENTFNNSMEYMFYQDYGFFPTSEEKNAVDKSKHRKMIYNFCKYKKLSTELSSFRIFPELSAVARWNTSRKYSDGNDTLDFLHATSALPYYDYFFTEKELKTMIEQRKMDKLYNCRIESNLGKVIEILNLL